jgi:hypothetical protein
MKYSAVIALLLPASALASPMVEVRQPAPRAKFIGRIATEGTGCTGATVTFDETNEVANVTLPNYSVSLPGPNREEACAVTLTVQFPAGFCTTGTAFGTVSGQVTLPNNQVSATFHGRDYAVSPSGQVTQTSPDGQWTGPINERYGLDDTVSYTYNRPDANNNLVRFKLQGQLQLQPSNGPSGFLSNDRFVFDIRTQIPCCEFDPLLKSSHVRSED